MSWAARVFAFAKSAEAAAHGYLVFCVGGRYFLAYSSARREFEARRAALPPDSSVALDGLHIWKGWRGFRYAVGLGDPRQCPCRWQSMTWSAEL